MREPRAAWVAALRRLEGCEDATIEWNAVAHRWAFNIRGADGVMRAQMWGRFDLPVDPVTGLHPFRDLDDAAMREAIANLERTFVGNRFDGAGTTRKEVLRRVRFNRDHLQRQYRAAGEAFADMAAERAHRLRGAPIIHVPVTLTGQRVERA